MIGNGLAGVSDMKATEQLSGMEMMAVDPINRVIVPRFVGGILAMPLLAAVFSAVGILGGYLVAGKSARPTPLTQRTRRMDCFRRHMV